MYEHEINFKKNTRKKKDLCLLIILVAHSGT